MNSFMNNKQISGQLWKSTSLMFEAYFSQSRFVPKCDPVQTENLIKLQEFINNNGRICILTGAGVSTESGIPDYRSTGIGLHNKVGWKPVLYQEFCKNESVRKRYWAKNFMGWPRFSYVVETLDQNIPALKSFFYFVIPTTRTNILQFSSIRPNITHKWLKNAEDNNLVKCIVTQNVDTLHSKAGNTNIIELHGQAFRVMCLNCDYKFSRFKLQEIFEELNPQMDVTIETIRPDGDVDLSQDEVKNFNVPSCSNCGGILKPDIVFFGDNVPRSIVDKVKENIEQADSLMILGTTLSTFSAYRIVLQAIESKKPIALVNIGQTRADKCVNLKIEGKCGEIFSSLSIP